MPEIVTMQIHGTFGTVSSWVYRSKNIMIGCDTLKCIDMSHIVVQFINLFRMCSSGRGRGQSFLINMVVQ